MDIRKILKAASSLKITTWSMVLLLIVVFWGTLYQSGNGLYAAQEKFFHSWYFMIFDIIPFPGVISICTVLFINLCLSLFIRIGFRLKNTGNLIAHAGIIFLLTGSFLSYVSSEHTRLSIKEGSGSNKAFYLHKWELAVQKTVNSSLETSAVDLDKLKNGQTLTIDNIRITPSMTLNQSVKLMDMKSGKTVIKEDSTSSIPGITISIESEGTTEKINLWGEDRSSQTVELSSTSYRFRLRRRVEILPLTVYLKDFVTEMHPNSSIPRSYISLVRVTLPGGESYDGEISMNKPFRYGDYTLFQSSFFRDKDGTEYTILAVVRNSSRLIPYISGLIIFIGMVIHFSFRPGRREDD